MNLFKWSVAPDVLSRQKLESFEGKSVADAVTMSLVKFGENLSVRRNLNFKVRPGVFLSAYVHPRPSALSDDDVLLGHYAAALAFRPNKGVSSTESYDVVGSQLCQHIIGMNPRSIGNVDRKPQAEHDNKAPVVSPPLEDLKEERSERHEEDMEVQHEEDDILEQTQLNNETELLHQSFLLNPDITVLDFLEAHQLSVVDYVRLELGDTSGQT
ncbi:unnamed protein product [Soboliphyme baturini]|uniref:EF_TS domain-containing protein n=1 Tax=Soboliphyme baturini TaxID=241478 RepID=A0A183J7J2_9BILA|nr:unnamed protein product [Soboliphyme baturini]